MPSVGIALAAGALVALSGPSWTAQLDAVGGSGIRGTARVEGQGPMPVVRDTMSRDTTPRDSVPREPMPQSSGAGSESRASISIEGARGGMSHAWHVHQGRCGSTPGPIVGQETAYPPIAVDERGKGAANATLGAGLMQDGQQYSVSVHDGPSKEDKIVSCGDLRADQGVSPER